VIFSKEHLIKLPYQATYSDGETETIWAVSFDAAVDEGLKRAEARGVILRSVE